MPCISGIFYNLFKNPEMMAVAKEEGLTHVIEKTIENNINAYPSAVERLVDVKNILLQNEHPAFDQSSSDDDYDYFNDESGDEDDSSNSDDDDVDVHNIIIKYNRYIINIIIRGFAVYILSIIIIISMSYITLQFKSDYR